MITIYDQRNKTLGYNVHTTTLGYVEDFKSRLIEKLIHQRIWGCILGIFNYCMFCPCFDLVSYNFFTFKVKISKEIFNFSKFLKKFTSHQD